MKKLSEISADEVLSLSPDEYQEWSKEENARRQQGIQPSKPWPRRTYNCNVSKCLQLNPKLLRKMT